MKYLLSTLFLCWITVSALSQQLDFFREEITFELDSLFFTVNGDYYFRNNSDKFLTPTVTFPVADPGSHKPFDTILVFAQENIVTPLPVVIKDTTARFTINLPPRSERMFKVIYRQRHDGQTARYILTTTAYWKKPIDFATYSLVVPEYIAVDTLSILPDTLSQFEANRIYFWRKESYMPEIEFVVSFTVNSK